ncbi:MAG: hypothetical protein A2W05_00345 [Candidatus Schekmanbacteria bacterium RBG_16_38_10]|uniref:O-antigen ligase-related domain-containing protein n=1 Tax=Candidatus Schekmanbacteria bacterium RBG_16_38_10 TaxID=1817879 RepID=A0A1F7RQL2_9BACT|nr:MAG: hypothetical protein A2W05_00345 [Candidatus Schekmanbacteria bacterium RBG_16_38_10]
MPPQLALIICIIFVLWLLHLERKQAPNVSRVLWIPTIWMLSIASKPFGVWFMSAGADAEAGSPLDRVFLSVILCLGLIILASRKFSWSRAIKENSWLMLLVSYLLVSILWSDIPFISFKRWIREVVAVVMAFIVMTERNPRQALESILRRTVYVLIPFSLVLINYYSAYGRVYGRWSGELMWVGVTQQKNGLGRLCLISVFFLVWTLARRLRGHDGFTSKRQTYADVFVLIVALWLLKGPPNSYPATAFVALSAGLLVFWGLLWIKKSRVIMVTSIFIPIIALGIVFGTVTLFVNGSTIGHFTSTLGREESLTGRTDVWAELLPVVMQSPIWGSGFGGFWTPKTREAFRISEGHSGYLDVLIELGFVGLLLFSIFLLSSCRKAQRALSDDFDWASLSICFFLMAVIHNITESSINSFTSHLTAILLFLNASFTSKVAHSPREVQYHSPNISRKLDTLNSNTL